MMVMVVDLYGSILMYIPTFIAKFYRCLCVCVSEYLPFGHKVIEAKKNLHKTILAIKQNTKQKTKHKI